MGHPPPGVARSRPTRWTSPSAAQTERVAGRAPSTCFDGPLPRLAGEERGGARLRPDPPPFTGEGDRRRRWRGRLRAETRSCHPLHPHRDSDYPLRWACRVDNVSLAFVPGELGRSYVGPNGPARRAVQPRLGPIEAHRGAASSRVRRTLRGCRLGTRQGRHRAGLSADEPVPRPERTRENRLHRQGKSGQGPSIFRNAASLTGSEAEGGRFLEATRLSSFPTPRRRAHRIATTQAGGGHAARHGARTIFMLRANQPAGRRTEAGFLELTDIKKITSRPYLLSSIRWMWRSVAACVLHMVRSSPIGDTRRGDDLRVVRVKSRRIGRGGRLKNESITRLDEVHTRHRPATTSLARHHADVPEGGVPAGPQLCRKSTTLRTIMGAWKAQEKSRQQSSPRRDQIDAHHRRSRARHLICAREMGILRRSDVRGET